MNCGQNATVAVCAFAPTGLLADPPGQTPREAACGVSPHCSCGPKRGTLPWPLSFPKTKSQMPWHSQLMGKDRQPAFVHCHGSSAHAAATLLPRRGSTCNSPSPCDWLLTCHWRTCIFSGPALCHFFRPLRGEVQRVLPRGAQRPLADNLHGALGEHHLVVLQAVWIFALCYPMRGCSLATLTWVTCPYAYCLMHTLYTMPIAVQRFDVLRVSQLA